MNLEALKTENIASFYNLSYWVIMKHSQFTCLFLYFFSKKEIVDVRNITN